MNHLKTFTILLFIPLFISSCDINLSKEKEQQNYPELTPLVEKVLTAEEQAALSPQEVINELKAGNERFISNDLTARDHSMQVRKSTQAQFPKAIVLFCVDSRVPVEDVFDRGIGDIFVARVAGNFVNEDILGSMEFACKVAGAKLILVMGHDHCGAVKSAIDDVKLGNITAMLSKIRPAVEKSSDFSGEQKSGNEEFVSLVCETNVMHAIMNIRTQSPILKEMEANGELMIRGAVYDMETGKVALLDN